MDMAFNLADAAIVFATLMGPILAIQTQKWLEHGREIGARQMTIFRTLMATRATRLAQAHVEALNATPIEFYGKLRSLQQVMQAWRLYMEHLNRFSEMNGETWVLRRDDLYAELLQSMAIHLNYGFDKSQLQREIYLPSGHARAEGEQEAIRQGLAKLLAGQNPLQLSVQSFPVDEEMRLLLTTWLKKQLDPGDDTQER